MIWPNILLNHICLACMGFLLTNVMPTHRKSVAAAFSSAKSFVRLESAERVNDRQEDVLIFTKPKTNHQQPFISIEPINQFVFIDQDKRSLVPNRQTGGNWQLESSKRQDAKVSKSSPFAHLINYLRKNFNDKSKFVRKLVRLKSPCSDAYVAVRNHSIVAKKDEEEAFTSSNFVIQIMRINSYAFLWSNASQKFICYDQTDQLKPLKLLEVNENCIFKIVCSDKISVYCEFQSVTSRPYASTLQFSALGKGLSRLQSCTEYNDESTFSSELFELPESQKIRTARFHRKNPASFLPAELKDYITLQAMMSLAEARKSLKKSCESVKTDPSVCHGKYTGLLIHSHQLNDMDAIQQGLQGLLEKNASDRN